MTHDELRKLAMAARTPNGNATLLQDYLLATRPDAVLGLLDHIEALAAKFNAQLPKSEWVTELYRLQDESGRLMRQLAAVTAARDAACDRLEECWSRMYSRSEIAEVGDGGVAELRKAGAQ